MSKFFKDVGEVVSLPFKTIYNVATNNPKGNSIGDVWNNTIGPGNPFQQLAYDFPGQSLERKLLGNDSSQMFHAPNWDTMGRPGEAFATHVDDVNHIFPKAFQPYAQPVEGALLNFVPGVGPLLSAGFNTAYQGGKEQQMNKGFDWGELGKNAAINFGTAAATMGANSLVANAKTANAAKTFNPGPSGFSDAAKLSGSANAIGTSALDPFSQVGRSAATPGFAATAAAVPNTANALSGAGITSALSGFNHPAGSSQSLIPQAQAAQTSGLGDAVYQKAVQGAPKLINQGLTDTLAPQGTQPIGGVMDNFAATDGGTSNGYNFGDILNAFGGSEITTPNPDGNRIDASAFDQIGQRLSANNYLQQNQARDTALPAGQYQAPQNTPYANRLTEINKGTDQAFSDLLNEVSNYNKYYGVIDSNPGLTPEQLDTFLQNPDQGVLGNFQIPQDQMSFFQGLRPLAPQNTSLLM